LVRDKSELDGQVLAAFARFDRAYGATPGTAVPRPPAAWSNLAPKSERPSTPFGKLFSVVRETDDEQAGSLA
jgi:hypothetical protein